MARVLYSSLLKELSYPIVIATGPAGTGKTMMACKAAAASTAKRLILTRPAVSADESHGFLPGTLDEKMEHWVKPMTDVLPRYLKPENCPLAFMRGRTFSDCWILADEMQNSTPNQMKMLLTRIGQDSKLVITGDLNQYERGFEENGLRDLIERLRKRPVDGIGMVEFSESDVMRHQIIKEILRIYS